MGFLYPFSAFVGAGRTDVEVLVFTRFLPLVIASLAATPVLAAPAPSANKLATPITLTDGHTMVRRTRKELGFTLAPANSGQLFTVDRAALKAALTRIAPAFHAEAQDPRPFLYKGRIGFKPGRHSRALNVPTTAEIIAQTAAKNPAAQKFSVALNKKPAVLTVAKMKGITGVIGRATTKTSENPKRNHNIALAVSFIDGTLLSPGETFSLNGEVGKRTQARGFRTAKVFEEGKIVPGIGGGVSQVTGTLFNAAAKSGLKIVEVHPHSRPVAYLPEGYDATVVYGEWDLKFTNDTKTPVFVDYRWDSKTRNLTAKLWGAKVPGKVVRLKASVQRLAPGKVDAQLYRVIKKNGKIASKERLFAHKYRWDPKDKG